MSSPLLEQTRRWRRRAVCLVGVGDLGRGDDGFGVALAREVEARLRAGRGAPGWRVVDAGAHPERAVLGALDRGFDDLVFLDAVDVGAAPGAVVLLGAAEIAARWPQVSTHRLSLGLLARAVEARGTTRAWLLGAQPASLAPGAALTPALRVTLGALAALLCPARASSAAARREVLT